MKLQGINRRRGLRWYGLLPVGVAIPIVASASMAFASTIVGSTTVTPTSGPPGTTVTARATGLTAFQLYNLKFADSAFLQNDQCMHATTIGGSTLADTSGNVPATSGTIPADAATGAGEVCFADIIPGMATDSSTPTAFTVT